MERAPYRPRRPEETVLHKFVRENLEEFLDRAERQARGRRGLPKYVEGALRRFVDCGMLARGFARVRCPACALDTAVPFSCKDRSLCPSCAGRRMADIASHVVDRCLPRRNTCRLSA